MNIKDIFQICFDFFFPHRCFSCKQIVQDSGGMCNECWLKIKFLQKPCCAMCSQPINYQLGSNALCAICISNKYYFDKLYFAVIFNNFSKTLIHNFKFYDQIYFSKFFAKLIYSYWSNQFKKIDYIIPVPMHKSRLFSRKFNQSALLVQDLSALSNKKNLINGLIRYRKTAQQANLNTKQREKNIKNSIILNKKYAEIIKYKNILLVDDVFTTGATVNECARILKLAGVSTVKVATVARVLPEYIHK